MSTPQHPAGGDTNLLRFHADEPDCPGVASYVGYTPRRCPLCGRSICPSLPRRRDDHSASRRLDVLLAEAPHLVAGSYHRDRWNHRAVLLLALALVAFLVGYALSMLLNVAVAHASYGLAIVLVFAASFARARANRWARR